MTENEFFAYAKAYPEAVLIWLGGHFDIYNAESIKRLFTEQVREGQIRFIIDLNDVEYMDSTALGLLANLNKTLRGKGEYKIAFVSTNPKINRIFEITGLNRIFEPYYSTAEDARMAIKKWLEARNA